MEQVITKEHRDVISTMLEDVMSVMLEHDAETPSHIDYSNKDVCNAVYILNHICFNKIWERMERENCPTPLKEKRAQEFGELMRALLIEFTDLDMQKLIVGEQ